ncbi:sugar transferase [Bosea sp. (in: a-proteobacteria)]
MLRGLAQNRHWLGTIFLEAIAAFAVLSALAIWASALDTPLVQAVPFALMTFGVVLLTGAVTLFVNRRTLPVTRAILVAGTGMVVYMALLAVARAYYSLSILAAGFAVAVLTCGQIGLMLAKNRFLRIGVLPFSEQERFFSFVGTSGLTVVSLGEDITEFEMLVVEPKDLSDPAIADTLEKAFLAGTEVISWSEFVEERKGRVVLDRFNVNDIEWSAQQHGYLLVKRVADFVASLILAVPAAILVSLAAIAIKFSMGGKILFAQKRVGRGGTHYTMYKLRTMREGPPKAIATTQADSRITPLGAILRRYRIDELPQLWNIIRGDMSFIGPRPEQPELAARYMAEIRGFNSRHAVTPGLSGWAQVKFGYAANTNETAEKVSYDLFYVKNISLDLDLRIVFKTIGTILGGTGAR